MASISGSRSPRYGSRHNLPEDGRLAVIAEDGEAPPMPHSPPRTHHKLYSRRWAFGDPPRHSFEKSPPPYSIWNITGPKGEKLADVRSNKYIARRGGWRKLLIIALLVLAVAIALIVGLVVGLRHKDSSKPQSSSANSSTPDTSFPVGTYALDTFLDTVSTNCTSNPDTWRCYPYTTYSSSPSLAMATFNWIITPANASGPSTDNFTISSTNNPFAIYFSNLSMTLLDANTSTERYTFSFSSDKTVVPSAAITTDNSQSSCNFNSTIFSASLYTRQRNIYPANSTTSASSTSSIGPSTPTSTSAGSIQPWPFAVEVSQSIGGGANVPQCFKVVNGNAGDRITDGLAPRSSQDICNCVYKNYDP
ncbi:hypothetical protein MMC09_004573 [Bachmanniomyces sp. S44760]|nr:hypothetical protein [Bachmanniomyces sp. S44760]